MVCDFSKWDYSKLENAVDMFSNCHGMKWNAKEINFKPIVNNLGEANYDGMFDSTKIIVPSWYKDGD